MDYNLYKQIRIEQHLRGAEKNLFFEVVLRLVRREGEVPTKYQNMNSL